MMADRMALTADPEEPEDPEPELPEPAVKPSKMSEFQNQVLQV